MKLTVEKATNRLDLPHPFAVGNITLSHGVPGEIRCECGRWESDPLHDESVTHVEQASASARLQTEKGS